VCQLWRLFDVIWSCTSSVAKQRQMYINYSINTSCDSSFDLSLFNFSWNIQEDHSKVFHCCSFSCICSVVDVCQVMCEHVSRKGIVNRKGSHPFIFVTFPLKTHPAPTSYPFFLWFGFLFSSQWLKRFFNFELEFSNVRR